jgi:hypothetical protein
MEQTFVTEREFNLSNQRIADENHRQNERINMLETNYAIGAYLGQNYLK